MDGPRTQGRQAARNVFLTAVIAGLAGLLFGYDTGVVAGALLFITPDFHLTSFQAGLVVGAVPLGAVGGAVIAGRISDEFGRKESILASSILFILGALASAVSPGTAILVIARIFVGIAIGIASAVAPVYISEVAPPERRGRLVTFFQLAVTIGIVVAYLVGLAFDATEGWRWMLGLGAVPAAVLGLGMLRMPASPRWLMMKGRVDAARATLTRIRANPATIDAEIAEIRDSIVQKPGGWSDLKEPVVRAALLVGIGLAILQQLCGINTVMYYAPTIVRFTGVDSSSSSILAAVGVGVVNVGVTIIAIRLLDRVGRRPLLIWGSAAMMVSLFCLGAVFAAGAESKLGSALAILSLMGFVAAFAISLGPIFWLLNAEIYPLRVRGKAAALGTMANWAFNFVVSLTFLVLIDAVGRAGTFFIYGAICAFTIYFCWRLVPETKGKHLEDIQAMFRERVKASAASAS